jgi:hypothetical protein
MADERSAVVGIASEEARRGVVAPGRYHFVDKPSSLRKVDPKTTARHLVARVHVLGSVDRMALCVVEGDAVLTASHSGEGYGVGSGGPTTKQ